MPDGNRKPEGDAPDPEKLAKLLEIELMQKRAGWQQAKQRSGALRAASFFFLFVIFLAALVAFWWFFSPDRVQELRRSHSRPNDSTRASTATP